MQESIETSLLDYTSVYRYGLKVVSEGTYNGIKIAHTSFKNTIGYRVQAPHIGQPNSTTKKLRNYGCWIRPQKCDAFIPWTDINQANHILESVFESNFVNHREKNIDKTRSVGSFMLSPKAITNLSADE
jgi:hypothetical protein